MIQESGSSRPEAAAFEKMLWQYRGEQGMLIPMLQAAQDGYGYVPASAIERISCVTGIPEAEICGVITFYKQFRLKPLGRHIIRLCKGTACHVVGAETIGQVISDELDAAPDETTEDGIFTYMVVACLGCCSLAPAMMIDDQTFGRLTPQTTRKLLRQYRRDAAAAKA
ncbi:MAG: NADH-quinone oxidoreductase subunit NuoE [Acidobacteria bacterium]|nr:NADH-quinone oxidoreductase subunit NuoE [Acidobacteriota bacterium]